MRELPLPIRQKRKVMHLRGAAGSRMDGGSATNEGRH